MIMILMAVPLQNSLFNYVILFKLIYAQAKCEISSNFVTDVKQIIRRRLVRMLILLTIIHNLNRGLIRTHSYI